MKEAHDDLQAKRYAEAISTLKIAEAIKGRTPYDNHLIHDTLAYAYVHTHDYADAATTWEAEISDGFTTGPESQQKIRALSALNYQLKNYDKAIDFGQRAIKSGYSADDNAK